MLNSLSYSVTFPSTGRRLAASVDFQKGFGSITGPNEAGKTFVIEMVRFCLFGSSALRHTVDSYLNLEAVLDFTVRGVGYTVHRGKKPRILQGDEVIAVGTSPVTAKVVEKLGYGLDVFDVANVANQGDLERLGSMRPTERKRMVDNVIGLGVIEDLTKWCGDQATGFSREADAISSVIREPVEPDKPERLVTQQEVDQVLMLKSELDRIEGWLENELKEPAYVSKPEELTVELLEAATQESRDEAEIVQLRRTLSSLPPRTAHSDEELAGMLVLHDQADAWEEWNRLPKRSHDVDTLNLWRHQWDAIGENDHNDRINAQLSKANHHDCPKCQHRFPADPDYVEKLKESLYLDVPPRPETPPLTAVEIERQLEIPDRPEAPIAAQRPAATRKQIVAFQTANQRAAERTEIEARIAHLNPTTQWRDAYEKHVGQMRDYAAFVEQMDSYLSWSKERAQRLVRAKDLRGATTALPELQRLLSLSQAYERDLDRFLKESADHARLTVQVRGLRDRVEGWRKARAALVTLRLLVKQHLLPSLNKVASHLLVGMTGGQRRSIVVDDDFEVTVDGQPLDTLSGSGKSVANLALRLGLGQVLTNNVFSVFIGDEIDAFMDVDRAENTANTLRLLKVSISQILLVTHKYPPADFYIDLGTHEQRQSD